jgi:hypothetical protein
MNDDAFDRFVQRVALTATMSRPFRALSSLVLDGVQSLVGRQTNVSACCIATGACNAAGDICVRDLAFCCESVFACVACDSRLLASGAVTENIVGCCLPGDSRCHDAIRAACVDVGVAAPKNAITGEHATQSNS